MKRVETNRQKSNISIGHSRNVTQLNNPEDDIIEQTQLERVKHEARGTHAPTLRVVNVTGEEWRREVEAEAEVAAGRRVTMAEMVCKWGEGDEDLFDGIEEDEDEFEVEMGGVPNVGGSGGADLQISDNGGSPHRGLSGPLLMTGGGANDNRGNRDINRMKLENAMFDMPYVSTRGCGPNHDNKINGFLYQYRKADDIKIVCVCHGFFLSPAEFVRHGGGGDVAHPLKHILMTPFPPLFKV